MKGMMDGLPQEPAKKKEKPLSLFGSFTAALNDGMMLAFSNYGNQGKSPAAGKNCQTKYLLTKIREKMNKIIGGKIDFTVQLLKSTLKIWTS